MNPFFNRKLTNYHNIGLRNGTYVNNPDSLVHVVGLRSPRNEPLFNEEVDSVVNKSPESNKRPLEDPGTSSAGQPSTSKDSTPPKKIKNSKKTTEAVRVPLPRAAKERAPNTCDTEIEADEGSARQTQPPPRPPRRPTPPPPYANATQTQKVAAAIEMQRIELQYHQVANGILDHSRRPSRLRHLVKDMSDPFYSLFITPFRYPPSPLRYPCSYYVSLTFNEFLPFPRLPQLLPQGYDAYVIFAAWVAALRSEVGWSTKDTGVILPRLQAILKCIMDHAIPFPAPPQPTLSTPALSPDELLKDVSTSSSENDGGVIQQTPPATQTTPADSLMEDASGRPFADNGAGSVPKETHLGTPPASVTSLPEDDRGASHNDRGSSPDEPLPDSRDLTHVQEQDPGPSHDDRGGSASKPLPDSREDHSLQENDPGPLHDNGGGALEDPVASQVNRGGPPDKPLLKSQDVALNPDASQDDRGGRADQPLLESQDVTLEQSSSVTLVLPPKAEALVATIERLGKQPSSIPQGTRWDRVGKYFSHTFWYDGSDSDEILEALNTDLDNVIGVDTLTRQLTLGPLGLDGLLRGWYTRSRQFHGWYDYLDNIINAKLVGIAEFIKEHITPADSGSGCPISDPPAVSTSATQVPRSSAPPVVPSTSDLAATTQNNLTSTPQPLTSQAAEPETAEPRTDTHQAGKAHDVSLSSNSLPAEEAAHSLRPHQEPTTPKESEAQGCSAGPTSATSDIQVITQLTCRPIPAEQPATPKTSAPPKPLPEDGLVQDDAGQELGQPISMTAAVAEGKRKQLSRVSSVWKGTPASLLAFHVQSMAHMKVSHDDIPLVYEATINFLSLRRQDTGHLTITLDTPLPPDVHFKVNRKVKPVDWLKMNPSEFFL